MGASAGGAGGLSPIHKGSHPLPLNIQAREQQRIGNQICADCHGLSLGEGQNRASYSENFLICRCDQGAASNCGDSPLPKRNKQQFDSYEVSPVSKALTANQQLFALESSQQFGGQQQKTAIIPDKINLSSSMSHYYANKPQTSSCIFGSG